MAKELRKGFFICFEGPEGSGKSTHSRYLAGELESEGYDVLYTFEPGATGAGSKIRALLLDDQAVSLFPETELLLFEADRAQHVREVVQPALDEGKLVLSDRYSMATMAYQWAGLGLKSADAEAVDRFATAGLQPGLTILLDVDVEEGLRRAAGRSRKDKIERRELYFHRKVREAYLEMARSSPGRTKVVKVEREMDETRSKIRAIVDEELERYTRSG